MSEIRALWLWFVSRLQLALKYNVLLRQSTLHRFNLSRLVLLSKFIKSSIVVSLIYLFV